ncbi:hypothetical protein AWC38_SpisGene1285 [Stylophora pistillata]|uniref:Uncharacterized protein n=1 Tax=Stylophora pistillata TaxID=50429 RepID=A0A2B4SY91_STYPI|nr:hypothetical protein AWC38_SpisGene1285 [Stylophora pistillata]
MSHCRCNCACSLVYSSLSTLAWLRRYHKVEEGECNRGDRLNFRDLKADKILLLDTGKNNTINIDLFVNKARVCISFSCEDRLSSYLMASR